MLPCGSLLLWNLSTSPSDIDSGGSTRSSVKSERGNPAVVVLLEHPLPDDELQQIAFEMGVSETAFVRRVGDQWSLRWFTPTVEVDLCGHATLATLHVLLNELGVPGGEFFFATRAGVLSGRRLQRWSRWASTSRAPSWRPSTPRCSTAALGVVRESFQAGPSMVLAIVEDYETLCGLSVDPLGLFAIPSAVIVAACEGGPDVDVSIRVFAPRLGLAEDHVTGSAMCAVAPWWVEQVGSPTVAVRQASARGGLMYARLFERNVEVAGLARTFLSWGDPPVSEEVLGPGPRTRVRRLAKKATYDQDVIFAILDEA